MTFDRGRWNDVVRPGQGTPWHCPGCRNGFLVPREETYQEKETAATVANKGHEDWEPEWDQLRFALLLGCSSASCGEVVAAVSEVSYEMEFDEEHGHVWAPTRHVRGLLPSPRILVAPTNCPKDLIDELEASFTLFWIDRETEEFDWKKLPKELRLAVDSRPLAGAGQVEDTVNLLGHRSKNVGSTGSVQSGVSSINALNVGAVALFGVGGAITVTGVGLTVAF